MCTNVFVLSGQPGEPGLNGTNGEPGTMGQKGEPGRLTTDTPLDAWSVWGCTNAVVHVGMGERGICYQSRQWVMCSDFVQSCSSRYLGYGHVHRTVVYKTLPYQRLTTAHSLEAVARLCKFTVLVCFTFVSFVLLGVSGDPSTTSSVTVQLLTIHPYNKLWWPFRKHVYGHCSCWVSHSPSFCCEQWESFTLNCSGCSFRVWVPIVHFTQQAIHNFIIGRVESHVNSP